jgi:hypothetical protein
MSQNVVIFGGIDEPWGRNILELVLYTLHSDEHA